MSRYARRKDDNHEAIVAALRQCGCDVMVMEDVDLLVLRAGKLFLLEIKDGAKVPSKRALTPTQAALIRRGWPIHVVLSPMDALRAVGFVDARSRAETIGAAARARIDAEIARLMEGM